MDEDSLLVGHLSTTDLSAMSMNAPAEVRFTFPCLPGTHLVQMGPSTVIDADELHAAMVSLIPAEFVQEGSNGHT